MRDIFNRIYKNNLWGNLESVSGPSSTLARTTNLRAILPKIIYELKIESILDAPCGDFNWMGSVIRELPEIRYTGADIVSDLIEYNSRNNSNLKNVSFLELDITNDKLPSSDMMICRDCLFHFSYFDTYKFFINFINSDIKFLLTTTHVNKSGFDNTNITTGAWRWMDLFLPPYAFHPNMAITKISDGGGDRELVLFDNETIKSVVLKNSSLYF